MYYSVASGSPSASGPGGLSWNELWRVCLLMSTQYGTYALPQTCDPAWTFGEQVQDERKGWLRRWRHRPKQEELYSLDLRDHAGVIVGLTEEGVQQTQLRLAVNAAQQGWQVVLFDPYASEYKARTFVAAMLQAGSARAYVHPDTSVGRMSSPPSPRLHEQQEEAAWYTTTPGSMLPPVALRAAIAPSPPSFIHRLMTAHTTAITAPFTCADALYFGCSAWDQQEYASRTAREHLSAFVRSLDSAAEQPVLLLIEHPELLFEMEQISALFALLDQRQGSMFVSARSVADFGREAPRLLTNARTLLVHRSSTTRPFEPYVSPPWWNRPPFAADIMDEQLRQFEDDECLVIHAGQLTHIHVCPVFSGTQGPLSSGLLSVQVQSQLPSGPSSSTNPPIFDLDDDEVDEEELLAIILGPGSPAAYQKSEPSSYQAAPSSAPDTTGHHSLRDRKASKPKPSGSRGTTTGTGSDTALGCPQQRIRRRQPPPENGK